MARTSGMLMIMLLLTALFQAGCDTNRTASPQQDEAALSDKPAPISDENTRNTENAEKTGIQLAGLVEKNGVPHVWKDPDPVKGRTLNVTDFGADPADNGKDDRPFIQQAIDAARAGDEVYIPDGVYELYGLDPVNRDTQLLLRSGVHLRGESRENTILLSDLANRPGSKDDGASSAGGSDASVIHAKRSVNILISNLTITSSWNGNYPTNYKVNNPSRGGPKIGINLDETSQIEINNVIVEKFQRMGIRISRGHDNRVDHCMIRKSTDIGGGGAGYGVAILGTPQASEADNSSSFNIVENNSIDGSIAMRHGILLGYATQHNAIRGNTIVQTAIDSIDLHGDSEAYNEVYDNRIMGTREGAGIGLGNTGGTPPNEHGASGPYNYIHDNTITNSKDGIVVIMGTPHTVIAHNVIKASPDDESRPEFRNGITIKHALHTVLKDNIVDNETEAPSIGILITHDKGDANRGGRGAGDPDDVLLTGNVLTGNKEAIHVDGGTEVLQQNNHINK